MSYTVSTKDPKKLEDQVLVFVPPGRISPRGPARAPLRTFHAPQFNNPGSTESRDILKTTDRRLTRLAGIGKPTKGERCWDVRP